MLSWQEECSNPQFKFCQGKEGNDFLKYIFDFKISVYLKGFKVNIKYLLFFPGGIQCCDSLCQLMA